jgi:hypothetical protein
MNIDFWWESHRESSLSEHQKRMSIQEPHYEDGMQMELEQNCVKWHSLLLMILDLLALFSRKLVD